MVPVDPAFINSNVGPYVGLVCAHLVISTAFILILRSLIRAYRSMPVSQRRRGHAPKHRNQTLTFAGFALVSLLINVYNFVERITDSYKNWAFKNGQAYPVDVWTRPVWYPRWNSTDLQLSRWLAESDLQDCVKIMAGSWRDYWWQQQLATGATVFTIFLAFEGRRRNIPYLWAYLIVGNFIGLSVALNLFFLAVLHNPVSISSASSLRSSSHHSNSLMRRIHRLFVAKYPTWHPRSAVYIVPLLISFACTAFMPYSLDTSIRDLMLNGPQLLSFLFLLVTSTNILPNSFGTQHKSIHAAHESMTPVFRTAEVLSVLLYGSSSVFAFFPMSVPAQRSHSTEVLYWKDTTHLPIMERCRQALAQILRAISDHPIIQKIGWDVLLSAASLCGWAGSREVSFETMMHALGIRNAPFRKQGSGKTDGASTVASQAISRDVDAPPSTRKRTTGRSLSASVNSYLAQKTSEDVEEVGQAITVWVVWLFGGLGTALAATLGAEES